MSIYSDYLDQKLSFQQITKNRKEQLKRISKLRGGNDIVVFAADFNNRQSSIDKTDLLPFNDMISNCTGTKLDLILETPGGFAEIVEDLVRLIRDKYESFNIIIPGYAKSAGTIFAMAADDILMSNISSLGPIDAQMATQNGGRISADGYLEGLRKLKKEVGDKKTLNPVYIPILQKMSLGEIELYENVQKFSITLVKDWLCKYKFKNWTIHSSSGKPVTDEERKKKADSIAHELSKNSRWMTHSRSIKIPELTQMGLKINNYQNNSDLYDAITRYFTLLQMSFETNIYKIYETKEKQIYRFAVPQNSKPINQKIDLQQIDKLDFECPKCKKVTSFQIDLGKKKPPKKGLTVFPKNNLFTCPNCHSVINLTPIRLQVESQSGKKIL